jgi:UDP-2,3-diacylglucosamine pyrophosphatase LpxH
MVHESLLGRRYLVIHGDLFDVVITQARFCGASTRRPAIGRSRRRYLRQMQTTVGFGIALALSTPWMLLGH